MTDLDDPPDRRTDEPTDTDAGPRPVPTTAGRDALATQAAADASLAASPRPLGSPAGVADRARGRRRHRAAATFASDGRAVDLDRRSATCRPTASPTASSGSTCPATSARTSASSCRSSRASPTRRRSTRSSTRCSTGSSARRPTASRRYTRTSSRGSTASSASPWGRSRARRAVDATAARPTGDALVLLSIKDAALASPWLDVDA